MHLVFKNAPLVEIIAEVGWSLPGVGAQSTTPPFQQPNYVVDTTKHEEFFMRFGGEVYQLGFQASERLVPPGFPVFPNQAVYRYRRTNKGELFQVGPGLFTANALPPYRAWHEFEPTVSHGIKALLAARNADEKNEAFTRVSLRYINAFRARHMRGRSPQEFMREVLQIRPGLPEAVLKRRSGEGVDRVAMQLTLPVGQSMMLSINVGEGLTGGETALIFDLTVTFSDPINAVHEEMMSALTAARNIIHEIFIDSTGAIADDLQPENVK